MVGQYQPCSVKVRAKINHLDPPSGQKVEKSKTFKKTDNLDPPPPQPPPSQMKNILIFYNNFRSIRPSHVQWTFSPAVTQPSTPLPQPLWSNSRKKISKIVLLDPLLSRRVEIFKFDHLDPFPGRKD